MKTNSLSDKELRDLFQKEKRTYNDDLFRLQVIRKTEAFRPSPFLRIILVSGLIYTLFSIVLFVPGLKTSLIQFISDNFHLILDADKLVSSIYTGYLIMIILISISVLRTVKRQFL